MRILFSNLGYARGIDGSWRGHLGGVRHYLRCPPEAQQRILDQLKATLKTHRIDLACIAEIDAGSSNNRFFDQHTFLRDQDFPHGQAINKYRAEGGEGRALTRGKSNGFLARKSWPSRYRYLSHGNKKLIWQVELEGFSVWFGHFSLRPWIRRRQFAEIAGWLAEECGEVMLLGDFNNYQGIGELRPLTGQGLKLMNPAGATFRLGRYEASVDLCLVTPGLVDRCRVGIVPQPYSDHDALLVEVSAESSL